MEKQTVTSTSGSFFKSLGFWVILLGTALRFFASYQTYVVNPDGTLYIHQARALYNGLFNQATPCGTGFLSNYAFFIAGAYPFVGDWVHAARGVSVLFGSLTLVPLYFLLRRFFDESTTVLGVLIFACMPVLVGRSADVVRDPLYWFFLVLGMYFFTVRRWTTGIAGLLFSSLSFLMATWARVEALAVVLASAIYLLLGTREARFKKFTVFMAPIIGVAGISFGASWFFGLPPSGLYRAREVLEKVSGPITHYRLLRTYLADWVPRIQDPLTRHFLPESRNFVWLIALGTFANRVLEAFFYPLFAVFAVGFAGVKKRLEEEPLLIYFLLMVAVAAGMLYLHILQWWIIDNRHVAIIIFPGAVFSGFGLRRTRFWLAKRFGLGDKATFWILFVLILAVTLPKNLQPREKDKEIFKQIGEKVARLSGNQEVIRVAASMDTLRWLSFYANLHYRGAPCPQPYNSFHEVVGESYETFLSNLKRMDVRYFLWEEQHWPQGRFNFFRKGYKKDFKKIGRWKHRDTGHMVLLQLRSE